MAFKGSVYRTPPTRKRKWHKKPAPPPPAEPRFVIHLGQGVTVPINDLADLREFAETRGWKPR